MTKIIYVIALLGVVASCNLYNNQYTSQLKDLDSQLEKNPEMVWDSLKKIDTRNLNQAQLAYYYLLDASATDKNYVYLKSDSTLKIALEHYQDHKDFYNLARAQYYMGKYEQKSQRYKEAYELFKQAESNFKESQESYPHLLGLIYYQLALIQKQQANPTEAEILCQKSFDIFTEINDTIPAVYALTLKAVIEIDLKQFDQAKRDLFKSLDIITSIRKNSEQVFEAQCYILASISLFYRKTGNMALALEYNEKCLALFETYQRNITSKYYYNALVVYSTQNKLDSAKIYCNKMILAAQEEKNGKNLSNGYRILSILMEKEGKYQEACKLKNYYNKLKDSLNEDKNNSNMLEIEKRYNNAESERLLLKAKNSKLKAYFSIPIIILCAFILGFFLYSRHKKLKIEYNRLSKMVKHTEWGFLVTKEFITENHIAYDELERILNREKGLNNINSEIYNKFHEALIQQKANYSGRLFDRLTNFDGSFGTKFQKLFPEFNTDDLLMATMIHHKWKISDMTAIFHASLDATRKRKARLAHKISSKLDKEIDLDEYLANL